MTLLTCLSKSNCPHINSTGTCRLSRFNLQQVGCCFFGAPPYCFVFLIRGHMQDFALVKGMFIFHFQCGEKKNLFSLNTNYLSHFEIQNIVKTEWSKLHFIPDPLIKNIIKLFNYYPIIHFSKCNLASRPGSCTFIILHSQTQPSKRMKIIQTYFPVKGGLRNNLTFYPAMFILQSCYITAHSGGFFFVFVVSLKE